MASQEITDRLQAQVAEAVATAIDFTTTILINRQYVTERHKTLKAARAFAPQMKSAYPDIAREVMIYAVTPDGRSVFVPTTFAEETRPVVWTTPKHPGDDVRRVNLRYADGELGMIVIQHYGDNVRIAAFLPGIDICLPGDTPKTEPEAHHWMGAHDEGRANKIFDQYVARAKLHDWVETK